MVDSHFLIWQRKKRKKFLKKCREARIEKDKKIVQRDWNWHAGRKVENKETARKTNKSYLKWKRMKNKTSNEEVTLKRSEAENPVCSLSSPIDSMVLPKPLVSTKYDRPPWNDRNVIGLVEALTGALQVALLLADDNVRILFCYEWLSSWHAPSINYQFAFPM